MVMKMRLIDADVLLEEFRKEMDKSIFEGRSVREVIDNAPTIDAVPVVRCRDCRWWDKQKEQCGITPTATPYGHCHDGETLEHSMIKDAGR